MPLTAQLFPPACTSELGHPNFLLEPIENPYIAGPPVTGSLFVGREDILRNLPGRLNPTTRIINFNIQTLGTLNTAQLILALAQTLYDDLPAHILPHIPEPQSIDFPPPNPTSAAGSKNSNPTANPTIGSSSRST